jgi:hypothetical protein
VITKDGAAEMAAVLMVESSNLAWISMVQGHSNSVLASHSCCRATIHWVTMVRGRLQLAFGVLVN